MTTINVETLCQVLRDAAKAEVVPRFRHLDKGMIKVKSEAIDLVTVADQASERFIAERVRGLWPDALFIGEEAVAADPDVLAQLDDADLAVVVDPIDGTANYAAGLPLFAVMAAVISQGETVAGIIYDPMGDDWMLAEKGSGAFLRFPNGEQQKLQVSSPLPLNQMVGTASIAYIGASRGRILSNLDKVRVVANYRCAGHDYRLFASGHTQFAMFNKLNPWDHLAGALICEEAGAYLRRFDGSVYQPHHREGGLLITTDRDSWDTLRREVFDL